jgi:hypothetical protein
VTLSTGLLGSLSFSLFLICRVVIPRPFSNVAEAPYVLYFVEGRWLEDGWARTTRLLQHELYMYMCPYCVPQQETRKSRRARAASTEIYALSDQFKAICRTG